MAFAPYIDPRQYQPFNPSSDGRVPPPPDAKVPRRRLKATLSNGLMPVAPAIDEDADLLQQDDLAAIPMELDAKPQTFFPGEADPQEQDPLTVPAWDASMSPPPAAPDAITAPPQAHATAGRAMVPPAPRAAPDPFMDDADVNFGVTDFSKAAQAAPTTPAKRTLFGDVAQAPQEFKIHWGPQADGRVIQDVNTSAPAGYDYRGQNSAGVDQWSAPPPLDVSDYGHDMAQIRAPRPAPQAYTDPNEFRSDLRDWELQGKYSMGHIPDYIKMAQGIGDEDTADDLQSVLTGVPRQRSSNTLSGQAALKNAERLERQAAQSLPPLDKQRYDSLDKEIATYQRAQQNLNNSTVMDKTGKPLKDESKKVASDRIAAYTIKINDLKRQQKEIIDQHMGASNSQPHGYIPDESAINSLVESGLYTPEEAAAAIAGL